MKILEEAWARYGNLTTDIGTPDHIGIFLKEIEAVLFDVFGDAVDSLPSWYLIPVNYNEANLEWLFDDFRIGFSVCKCPDESSWWIAHQDIHAYGGMNYEKHRWIIPWILSFAVAATRKDE